MYVFVCGYEFSAYVIIVLSEVIRASGTRVIGLCELSDLNVGPKFGSSVRVMYP